MWVRSERIFPHQKCKYAEEAIVSRMRRWRGITKSRKGRIGLK
jgi:hypothetical protein